MAADIRDERGQPIVTHVGDNAVERAVDAARGIGHQGLAQPADRNAQKPLIVDVGHRLQARLQALTAGPGEQRLQLPAPAQLLDAPAARAEHLGELPRPRVGHDPVEALAIDVDDPQHVAEPPDDLLAQRLPDVALV
jgi:hypothetical protein